MGKYRPQVSVFQIENRVSTGDPDFTLMMGGRGRMVELKINKSKAPDRIKIKLRPDQRNTLRREHKAGNPAYLLICSRGQAFLIPGDRVDIFSAQGCASIGEVRDAADMVVQWPEQSGPTTGIRQISDFLFR